MKCISQAEAKRIMENEKDYVIIDVHRDDEFSLSHIPNAINLPLEAIEDLELSNTELKNFMEIISPNKIIGVQKLKFIWIWFIINIILNFKIGCNHYDCF